MKRTASCVFSCALLVGSASLAMAGAYGEDEVSVEAPAAPSAPAATATETTVEAATFDKLGGYIQAGGVYAIQIFEKGADMGDTDLDDADNAGGYEIRAGYRMKNWLAIEVEWEQYLHFTNVHRRGLAGCNTAVDGNPGCGANLDGWNLTANGKFYPITGRFQPYGLLGLGATKFEFEASNNAIGNQGKIDEVGFALKFGLGVDIFILENFGVAVEASYVLPFNDAHEFDIIPLSGSLFYRFG